MRTSLLDSGGEYAASSPYVISMIRLGIPVLPVSSVPPCLMNREAQKGKRFPVSCKCGSYDFDIFCWK